MRGGAAVTGIVIEELAQLAELRQRAPLLCAGAGADLFCSAPWFELLAAHGFDARARLAILLARDAGGRPVLALPLIAGAELTGLANFYSCLYGPLRGPGAVPAAAEASALAALGAHMRRQAPLVRLAPLDAAAPFTRAMQDALSRAGYWTDTYFCFGNWYLEVAGRPYDAVFAALPAALRNTIARRGRRLAREGAWSVAIQSGAGAGLDAAIADFEQVYARSWKTPEPFPRFIGELCRTAALQGWLRLGVLRLGDRPIAAQVWLHHGAKTMIYKLAYDQEFERFSPGSVLTDALMRHAIDTDRAAEVDFLSGDDAYKRDWMSHRRERIGIVAFDPKSARGLAAAARHFAGRRIAALIRAFAPARIQ